jgi:hypothetical protein
MLRLLGNVIFAIGGIAGTIKYKFGIIAPIPQRYRSSRWDQDDESSC